MKLRYVHIIAIILFAGAISGCVTGSGSRTQGYNEDEEQEAEAMEFVIIKDIFIVYDDDPSMRASLNSDDTDTILDLFHSAEYDTDRNDSGIMIKMTTPDYLVTIEYNPDLRLEEKTAFIWKESRHIKFDGLWYIIDESSAAELFTLLERHRP